MPLLRLTYPTTLVLYAVARGHAYGFDLVEATALGSGTVYPILRRLEGAGLLRGRAERAPQAHRAGRPPRRYYTVTETGAEALRAALDRHPAVVAALAAARGAPGPGGAPRPRLA